MDAHANLLSPLDALAQSLDMQDGQVESSVTELVEILTKSIPSYCGLRLTFTRHGYPVVLSIFTPGLQQQPVTSLRAPIAAFARADGSSPHEAGSQVVFYATVPGALVDLAADLSYALRSGMAGQAGAADPAVILDDDLPVTDLRSGLTGLGHVSTINRAVGLLIGEGHPPDEAHTTLRQQAAAGDLPLHLYAASILGR